MSRVEGKRAGVLLGICLLAIANEQVADARPSLGGPGSVEALEADDARPDQSHTGKDLLKEWKDYKTSLKDRTGFSWSTDYTAYYFGSSGDFGPNEAGSGIFRLYGSWDLVGRGTENQGGLVYKVEHRHRYSESSPSSYSLDAGNVGVVGGPFSNNNLRLTNLYWKQKFCDGQGTFLFGYLDATDFVDVYALANPWTAFTNLAFSTGSSSIALPNDATFGLAAGYWLSDQVYVLGSMTDLNADPTDPFQSTEYFFTEHEYFKSIEFGWTTSQDRSYVNNVHLTFWHVDDVEAAGTPDGWGVNFSASYWINDCWMPFFRAGYTEDGGSLLEASVSAGVGVNPIRGNDLLGIAVNWGKPNEDTFGPDLDDQYAIEIFYRYQLTENIAITPDIQWLIDPALNPEDDSLFLAGVRGRISF
ncbi:carbohydrate porin [Oceaniferula marina]|nr:carbohydrate porin [Oceaniferula marina]